MTTISGENFDLNYGSEVKFANPTGGEGGEEGADVIKVWYTTGAGGYNTFAYYKDEEHTPGSEEDETGWWPTDSEEEAIFPAGTPFWVRTQPGDNKSMTVSGAVESDADVEVTLVGNKYNLLINPYPTSIDFNDKGKTVEVKNATGGEGGEEGADVIKIWYTAGAGGYNTFAFYKDEEHTSGSEEDETGWWPTDSEEETIVPAGAGFWLRTQPGDNKSIVFKSPIAK